MLLSGVSLSRNSLLVKNHNPVRVLIVSLAWADAIFFFFFSLLLFANQRNTLLNLQSMANKNARFFPQNVSVLIEAYLKSVTSYSLCDDTVNLAEIVKPFLNSSSSAPWLTPAICCSWKVVSIMNKHTHTDQLLESRWPERSGHGTLIVADKLPPVALDDFFSGGGGVRVRV